MSAERRAGEFKTSIVGFRKTDVLAYIDELSAQLLEEQKSHEEKAAALQETVDRLEGNNETLIEKTKEACDKLTAEKKRANAEENRARTLSEQLLHAEETLQGYKNRLFTKEQEVVVLKSDNKRLTELLAARQQENETMLDRARQAEQNCNRQSEQCRQLEQQHQKDALCIEEQKKSFDEQLQKQSEEYAQSLQKEKTAARQMLLKERQQIAVDREKSRQQVEQGAQNVAESIYELRGRIGEVDRKIEEAISQLRTATSSIYAALGETERDLEGLGARIERFPEAETPKTSHRSEEKARETGKKGSRKGTVSDGLLELLERILK